MKYKDAGKKMEAIPAGPPEKYYPRVTLDEKGVDLCMDDVVPLRGRVCGIHKTEHGNSFEVEITEVGVPDVRDKSKEPRNEADRELAKLQKE